jgi:hypothetical protein
MMILELWLCRWIISTIRIGYFNNDCIATVHEIILEVPKVMADDAAAILRETMIEAGETCLTKLEGNFYVH